MGLELRRRGFDTNENPSYAYTTAGTYNVALTISNSNEPSIPSATSTQTTTITVSAGAVTTTVPAVTGISPTYGPVSTNTPIIITGTGFTGATAVTVGGTAVTSFTVVSSTRSPQTPRPLLLPDSLTYLSRHRVAHPLQYPLTNTPSQRQQRPSHCLSLSPPRHQELHLWK